MSLVTSFPIAAATEQGFYLQQLAWLVFGAAPIALILIGLTFLRRKERTRIVFGMQLAAGIWLAFRVFNRLFDIWHYRILRSTHENAIEDFKLYLSIAGVMGILETISFIVFAILFLIYCRQRVSKADLV